MLGGRGDSSGDGDYVGGNETEPRAAGTDAIGSSGSADLDDEIPF